MVWLEGFNLAVKVVNRPVTVSRSHETTKSSRSTSAEQMARELCTPPAVASTPRDRGEFRDKLHRQASNLVATASNLVAKASDLVAMTSNLVVKVKLD